MKLSTVLEEKELKDSVNVIELDKDDTSSKYKNSRITVFFPKVEKSDVLIEDLQLRIKNLERERNHIKNQLNELKKRQSENGKGMCKVIPTQTKTSSPTPKQISKKQQNTEKGAQSKKQVGRKKKRHNYLNRKTQPIQLPLASQCSLLNISNSNNCQKIR